MKMLISILLAIALSLAALAQSQDQNSGQGSQATQGNQGQSETKDSKGKNMSGTVSHDRKTFKSDANDAKKRRRRYPKEFRRMAVERLKVTTTS